MSIGQFLDVSFEQVRALAVVLGQVRVWVEPAESRLQQVVQVFDGRSQVRLVQSGFLQHVLDLSLLARKRVLNLAQLLLQDLDSLPGAAQLGLKLRKHNTLTCAVVQAL